MLRVVRVRRPVGKQRAGGAGDVPDEDPARFAKRFLDGPDVGDLRPDVEVQQLQAVEQVVLAQQLGGTFSCMPEGRKEFRVDVPL